MCYSIYLGETECRTRGELESALGLDPAFLDDQCENWLPHQCLCPCNVRIVAAHLGYRVNILPDGDVELFHETQQKPDLEGSH